MAADGYIDRDYVANTLGRGWIDAISGKVSIELFCRQASAVIASDLGKNGYTAPSYDALTAEAASVTKDFIQAATCGRVMVAIAGANEVRVDLPADWAAHACVVAYERIASEDGGVKLDLDLDTLAAVGGVGFSESDPAVSVSDGSNPARATRSNLAGY